MPRRLDAFDERAAAIPPCGADPILCLRLRDSWHGHEAYTGEKQDMMLN